jgi:two-component system response regulator FlrC
MRLLIIGSLEGHITLASKIAIARGAKVTQVDDVETGMNTIRAGYGAELVMVDFDLDIAGLVTSLANERISVPVVACGFRNDPEAAVAAIKAGAKEYIPLPPDPELIAAVLEAVVAEDNEIVFRDPATADVIALADKVAPSEASILILGESGTGKELMARHIHRKSKRAKANFVSVNCAAIPENLLESELFGHEKGSFTGAVARRIGRFEEADGGTLLLDEISEMDIRLQAKLLRAIQEREISRVGNNEPIKVDIRLIATSNRDLATEAAEGKFREDLYFRLNVMNLTLPPLRERPLDIALLADHFAQKYAEANAVPLLPVSDAALVQLRQHHWRGNVRELENAMHRAVLLASGDQIGPEAIQLTNTPMGHATAAGGANGQILDDTGTEALVGRTVAQVERELILDTLSHTLGNRTHAANILGISIRTLRNKLKLYTEQGSEVPMPGAGTGASAAA